MPKQNDLPDQNNGYDHLRSLGDIDRVIHEPARTMIVAILYAVESADFLYLKRETGLTRGNLSSHLSKLEQAGYVQIEKTYRGKIPLTLCHLTVAGREAFEAYRRQMKTFVEGGSKIYTLSFSHHKGHKEHKGAKNSILGLWAKVVTLRCATLVSLRTK